MASRFIINRIIGNALPPRHGPADSINHLQHILEVEPEFADCEKRWVLNRFVDQDIEARCIELIKAKGDIYHVIPFDREAYKTCFLDGSGMPHKFNPMLSDIPNDSIILSYALEWVTRHKSQLLIHINHARNVAIELGRRDAEWTLPLDGSCYFTSENWDQFVTAIDSASDALYAILPLRRLSKDERPQLQYGENHEPQIVFHRDAPDRFDERLRYGNRNKAELLVRLGVPGDWQKWKGASWDRVRPLTPLAPNRFVTCSMVFRAAPGSKSHIEISNQNRFISRFMGVRALSMRVNAALLAEKMKQTGIGWAQPINPPVLPKSVLEQAEIVSQLPIPLITDKSVVPPGGSKNDYISVPRYMHLANGKMYWRDGIANEDAIIGAPGPRKYDRSALHDCLNYVSTLTVSGCVGSNRAHLERAVQILECWFISPETAMTPDARYAQMRPDTPEQANPSGVIDFRDLWILPRLAQLLLAQGALSQPQYAGLRKWAWDFVKHQEPSTDATSRPLVLNNIATWSNLLTISLGLFAGMSVISNIKLCESSLRIAVQCGPGGVQSLEMSRSRPLHYSLFNATAWTLLAGLSRKLGHDLWLYRGDEGQSIGAMLRFIARNMDSFPEFANNEAYFSNWFGALAMQVPSDAADFGQWAAIRGAAGLDFNDPNTGLPPQWGYLIGAA